MGTKQTKGPACRNTKRTIIVNAPLPISQCNVPAGSRVCCTSVASAVRLFGSNNSSATARVALNGRAYLRK